KAGTFLVRNRGRWISQEEISDGARQSDDFTAVDDSTAADPLTFPLLVSTLLPSTGVRSSSPFRLRSFDPIPRRSG
ncbi:hypothetical protein LINPERPRIM_LOCUS2087, partial [Linum perenne]